MRVFGHMPIDAIAPMGIREYMDLRGQAAKVRANREKALFSHIFNKAREWGYTASQNPCQGVKGFKETESPRESWRLVGLSQAGIATCSASCR